MVGWALCGRSCSLKPNFALKIYNSLNKVTFWDIYNILNPSKERAVGYEFQYSLDYTDTTEVSHRKWWYSQKLYKVELRDMTSWKRFIQKRSYREGEYKKSSDHRYKVEPHVTI